MSIGYSSTNCRAYTSLNTFFQHACSETYACGPTNLDRQTYRGIDVYSQLAA